MGGEGGAQRRTGTGSDTWEEREGARDGNRRWCRCMEEGEDESRTQCVGGLRERRCVWVEESEALSGARVCRIGDVVGLPSVLGNTSQLHFFAKCRHSTNFFSNFYSSPSFT
jgi:hypothetical protein